MAADSVYLQMQVGADYRMYRSWGTCMSRRSCPVYGLKQQREPTCTGVAHASPEKRTPDTEPIKPPPLNPKPLNP